MQIIIFIIIFLAACSLFLFLVIKGQIDTVSPLLETYEVKASVAQGVEFFESKLYLVYFNLDMSFAECYPRSYGSVGFGNDALFIQTIFRMKTVMIPYSDIQLTDECRFGSYFIEVSSIAKVGLPEKIILRLKEKILP